MITYLGTVFITYEKSVLYLDNSNHVAVLYFVFCVLLWNLMWVKVIWFELLRTPNELLLLASWNSLLLRVGPIIGSLSLELRALAHLIIAKFLLRTRLKINKAIASRRGCWTLSILCLLWWCSWCLVVVLVSLHLHLVQNVDVVCLLI